MLFVVGLIGLVLCCPSASTRAIDDWTEYYTEYEELEEYLLEEELYHETEYFEHQHRDMKPFIVYPEPYHEFIEESSKEALEILAYEEESRLAAEIEREKLFLAAVASELAEEELIEEFERNARASNLEGGPIPYPLWYPYPIWMPYYLPYDLPLRFPADICVGQENVQLIPVKGKVIIVRNFGNCHWNMPPPTFPMPMPIPMSNAGEVCDMSHGAILPVRNLVPVSGKVTIAANFDC